LSDVWNTVWGFLKQWGPLALSILLPFIGIPLLIWQHFGQIVGWLKSVWNAARADLGSFVNWVSGAFNGMIGFFESIPGRIASIFTAAWNGITNGLKAALNWVIDRLNSFHVSIPSWVPVVGGDTFGFNIPHVAVGGPVSGMALVGEQGPELVNLPGGSSVYPNSNTMSMLNGMGGGGSVQVDFNITGNTNDALALIINQLIRMNKIQIRQSQVRPG
jgi:phage-related protein